MEHIGIIERQWLKATKPTRIAVLLFLEQKRHARGGHFFQTNKKKKTETERERKKKEGKNSS